jgi:hypothetical protein
MDRKPACQRVCLVTLAVFLLAVTVACGGAAATPQSSSTPSSSPLPTPSSSPSAITSVSVSPSDAKLPVGAAQQMTATLQGTGDFNPAVKWLVNTIPGGDAMVGKISATGRYIAPATIATSPSSMTIKAVSVQDPRKSASAKISVSGSVQSNIPQSRVALVVLEDPRADYSQILGSTNMPYLNSIISKYGLATNYFAVTHPSINNYFMLTTGQIIANNSLTYWGVLGNNYVIISDDNLVRELANIGKSWKAYAESLPSVGYLGPSPSQFSSEIPYYRWHVPFTYFSDVVNNPVEASNIVPFTRLATDLKNGALPDFIYIAPNAFNDMHDCSPSFPACTVADREQVADQWLSTNINPLLQDAGFQNNGLLIIVFDEATATDSTHGGGQVACVLASANIKPGYRSTVFYQHQNLEALIGSALRLATIPGAGATASPMNDFFQ